MTLKLLHWKQDCPEDQLTVIVMALQGHIDNLTEGIRPDHQNGQISCLLAEIRTLGRHYLEKNWKES